MRNLLLTVLLAACGSPAVVRPLDAHVDEGGTDAPADGPVGLDGGLETDSSVAEESGLAADADVDSTIDAALEGCADSVMPPGEVQSWVAVSNTCAWADRTRVTSLTTEVYPQPGDRCELEVVLTGNCDGPDVVSRTYASWGGSSSESGISVSFCPGTSDACIVRLESLTRLVLACTVLGPCEIVLDRL